MVTAYVILSRVKSAAGLALLRAFTPELFAQGPAPGPHCLMKFLRARLEAGSSSYSTEAAQDEYVYRDGKDKARARFVGNEDAIVPLRCGGCHNNLVPQHYPDMAGEDIISDEVWTDFKFECIFNAGEYRLCKGCKEKRVLAKEKTETCDFAECRACGQSIHKHFKEWFDQRLCGGCEKLAHPERTLVPALQ